MKKIIPVVIVLAAVITSVLFFINIKDKNAYFFYRLGFTILFEALFILCFGISADYKKLPFMIKIIYFGTTLLLAVVEFFLLYFAPLIFKSFTLMSKGMTTAILVTCGVEIVVLFTLFAAGNVFSNK